MTALLLVAHGSRDPRAETTVRELTAAVADRLPGVAVRAAYLDHADPAPLQVLLELAASGVRSVRIVPLLFAPGFHVRVDLPEVIARARVEAPALTVEVSATLGEIAPAGNSAYLLLDALDRRLAETGVAPRALVLASAGSSAPDARAVVHQLAARWSLRRELPVSAAFASGPGTRPDAAVRELGAAWRVPAERVVVGSLFLADGYLPGRTAKSVQALGAVCAPVLGPAPELVDVVLQRYAPPGRRAHRALQQIVTHR